MKKALVALTLVAFISGTAKSQINVHVGLNTTVNTLLLLDKGINSDPSYITVNNINFAPIGFSFGIDFSNKFGLQLETIRAIYDMAYKIKQQQEEIGELRFHMEYIQIPMLLRFMNGGTGQARMNFMLGPQISLITAGTETIALYQAAADQQMAIPDVTEATLSEFPAGTIDNGDGTYTMPTNMPASEIELLSSIATNQLETFRNQELHIVGGFGLDVDVSPKLYLSLFVKGDYGITDMRNGELIDALANNANLKYFTERRASLALGVQIGVHYMFNGTRFFLNAIR
ncbi:MAG: PorT family protein [Cyclobacteriaceae bacterium]|nr:PorT family protein [Cyclobacteriaceae bacterium]